ncbi:hypothetical protein GCM10007276_14430 [Agaricicola taiwanensis]|uniref:Uncharacterized protein n=1 Tax=Agaricicola taiwanensis TaxID=591372 RepID=A0A8J2YEP3_9RHOB|nr:hypothetical protein [Agaricicola taiwanensis]GGE38130.1 hypothetical protein GCM10007276_14430 [Agaricicola taiwanensis]
MSDRDLILPTSRIPSVKEFLDILHIKPASFAAQLFTAVYNQFFSWSEDLRVEYERYYCVEYPTFANYLELAHEIYLDPAEIGKTHILKIKSPGGVLDEDYDENVMNRVVDCIKKLEGGHES